MEMKRYFEFTDADGHRGGNIWRVNDPSPRSNRASLEKTMAKHMLHATRALGWKNVVVHPPLKDHEIMLKANEIAKQNGEEPRWSDEQIVTAQTDVMTKIVMLNGDGTQSEASILSLAGGPVRDMTPVMIGRGDEDNPPAREETAGVQ